AGHELRAARRAGARSVKVRPPLTLRRQPIDLRRPDRRMPVAAKVAVALVVRENDDKIRRSLAPKRQRLRSQRRKPPHADHQRDGKPPPQPRPQSKCACHRVSTRDHYPEALSYIASKRNSWTQSSFHGHAALTPPQGPWINVANIVRAFSRLAAR